MSYTNAERGVIAIARDAAAAVPAIDAPIDISTMSLSDEPRSIAAFSSLRSFREAQRIAITLATSTMVPSAYQGNIANCLVAMEFAGRVGLSVLMVMQHLHIIDGRPGWSSAFLISSVNVDPRFSSLRYQRDGDDPHAKATYRVRAYATEIETGDVLYGEWIDWNLVVGEGWLTRKHSKWPTMPGQMFMYRAAAFWVRAFAPEKAMGMQSADEIEDTIAMESARTGNGPGPSGAGDALQNLNDAIGAATKGAFTAPPVTNDDVVAIAENGGLGL